jgi:RNA polymerase sigma factor (sigma-70 family)
MTRIAEPQVQRGAVERDDDAAVPDRDLVGTYLHEISRTPLLDAAQEVELSKAVEAGLYAEHLLGSNTLPKGATKVELRKLVADGRRAKDAFILANLRLVVSIARRYTRSAMPLLDLVQEGNSGLVRAVEKFDYTRGYKFSTYATWWIRQAISRAIAQQARTVRLPVHLVEEINRLRNVRRDLTRELGRDPEPNELAKGLDVEVSRIEELLRWSRETVSLDTPVGEDGETALADLVADADEPSPEDLVIAALRHDRLGELLGQLDHRSGLIIRARFGLDDGRQRSLTEIAGGLGLSRERVRQLEAAALTRLRELATAEGLEAA